MLGDDPLTPDQFMDLVTKFKAKISSEIFPELMKEFTIRKANTIDVVAMRNKYISLYPDSTPPPTKNLKKNEEQKVVDEAEGQEKENAGENVAATEATEATAATEATEGTATTEAATEATATTEETTERKEE